MRATATLITAAIIAAVPCWAQAADIQNAKTESEQATGDLQKTVERLAREAGEPTWVVYSVPMVEGDRLLCCGDSHSWRAREKSCELEGRERNFVMSNRHGSVPASMASRDLLVFLRLESDRVVDLRAYSESCPVDAGGTRVVWLEEVSPESSAEMLHRFAAGDRLLAGDEDLTDEALTALALHDAKGTDAAVEDLAGPSHPEELREEAIFWLGHMRGRAGYAALDRLLRSENDPEIKEEIAFALTQSPVPEAIERLEKLARSDPSPEVRGEALFWLAQSGSAAAGATILETIRQDPDEDVREEA
ncbi:MAG: HEAT repeat domain-containing protein, partial [Thermoanaerobaculia bacterium]